MVPHKNTQLYRPKTSGYPSSPHPPAGQLSAAKGTPVRLPSFVFTSHSWKKRSKSCPPKNAVRLWRWLDNKVHNFTSLHRKMRVESDSASFWEGLFSRAMSVLQRKQWCFDSMVIYHGKNAQKMSPWTLQWKSDSSFPTCCDGKSHPQNIHQLAKLRLDPCHSVIRIKVAHFDRETLGSTPPTCHPHSQKITSHNFVALRDMSVVIPQSLTWKTSKTTSFGVVKQQGCNHHWSFSPATHIAQQLQAGKNQLFNY